LLGVDVVWCSSSRRPRRWRTSASHLLPPTMVAQRAFSYLLSFSSGSRGDGAPAALCIGDALQAARWRALCPRRESSFRPWRRHAPPLPCSSSSAPACQCALDQEEQHGQMRRRTFPASNEALSGEFFCPLPLSLDLLLGIRVTVW
jgi:hypothetical protein